MFCYWPFSYVQAGVLYNYHGLQGRKKQNRHTITASIRYNFASETNYESQVKWHVLWKLGKISLEEIKYFSTLSKEDLLMG